MALFVLGDTHLSLGGSKPMDVFPGWNGYVERLEANWRKLVKPEDTIVLAGDISWAMRLTDTRRDFEFLQQLPGQKLIMKGNHDYWWTTANKMNAYLKAEGFDTLHILHNNSYSVEGYAICGTRGWLFDVGEPHDEKVMNREIGRLKMSLDAAEPGLEKLVFLHYPPVYTGTSAPEIVATLKAYGIRTCYYGHLHGNAIRYAVQGDVDGIHSRFGSTSFSRWNCCQLAACLARSTAVSYSVRNHALHWCEVMSCTSFFHRSNGFRLPFESMSCRATSFCSRCVLNAANTAVLCRSALRKSSSGL